MADGTAMTTLEALELPARWEVAEDAAPVAWGQIAMVPVSALAVDRAYQREVGKRGWAVVRRIAEAFDPAAFGVLLGRWEGERFALIDGQHRALAAKARGLRAVPCLEVWGSPARTFVAINSGRVNLTPVQRFRAARAVPGSPEAALGRALDDLGVTVGAPRPGLGPRRLSAVRAAMNVTERHGVPVAEAAISVLLEAGEAAGESYLSATFVRAAGEVVAALFDEVPNAVGDGLEALEGLVASDDPASWVDRTRCEGGGGNRWARLARLLAREMDGRHGIALAVAP